jgi:hypothetical protein
MSKLYVGLFVIATMLLLSGGVPGFQAAFSCHPLRPLETVHYL